MSTLLLETETALAVREPSRRGLTVPGGRTLDDVISGAWARLAAGRTAGCPSCGEELQPAPGHTAVAGSCVGCGTRLS